MAFRVGTVMLGKVREAHGECIKTKFFLFGVPLFPVGSYFVSGEKALEIRLSGLSVLAGYLRIYCGFIGVIATLIGGSQFLGSNSSESNAAVPTLAAGLACLALFSFAMWRMGKPSKAEVQERGLLRSILGVGVLPGMLTAPVAHDFLDRLEELLECEGLPTGYGDLAAEEVVDDDVPLVYAAARYGEVVQPKSEWGSLAQTMKGRLVEGLRKRRAERESDAQ